jgi:hypothetical protein
MILHLLILFEKGMLSAEVLKMDRPRDVMLNRMLEDDPDAAELYSLLPEEVQSMVQQSAERANTAVDVEHMAQDYFDQI